MEPENPEGECHDLMAQPVSLVRIAFFLNQLNNNLKTAFCKKVTEATFV